MTVCRRYHELLRNLPSALTLAEAELGYRPGVVIVWARPEPRSLYLLNFLQTAYGVRVLGRPSLPGELPPSEGGATSYPESHNLRLGLENSSGDYVVCMAADILPRPGIFSEIDHFIRTGEKAVLFYWENGISRDAWHTNFFAVTRDPLYFPPLCTPADQDVLEVKWGKNLIRENLPFVRSHNSESRRFLHRHESESLPRLPTVPAPCFESLPLYLHANPSPWKFILAGVAATWRRLWRRLFRA